MDICISFNHFLYQETGFNKYLGGHNKHTERLSIMDIYILRKVIRKTLSAFSACENEKA